MRPLGIGINSGGRLGGKRQMRSLGTEIFSVGVKRKEAVYYGEHSDDLSAHIQS